MARIQFADTIFDVDGSNMMVALDNISVDVFFAGSTSSRPAIYVARTGSTQRSNPFTTATGGAVEFWVDEGDYDIRFTDNQGSPRIAQKTIGYQAQRPTQISDLRMASHNEGDSADGKWLIADGRAVSRTTYADYFALVGTSHGPGNGSSTFNIIDMASRVPYGIGTGSGLSAWVMGDQGGSEYILQGNLPVYDLPITDPGHTHNIPRNSGSGGGTQVANSSTDSPLSLTADASTTGITVHSGGSGNQFWTPGTAVRYLVKVK